MLDVDDFAASVVAPHACRSARRFVIRPVGPGDETNLGAFYRNLSPTSRHRRFLAVVNELPARLLAHFVRPEAPNEVVLIAATCDAHKEAVVGEARYVLVEPATRNAELAIAVTDATQRRGLGERLLRALIRRAAENGIDCLYGDVLPENQAMLALARKLGFSEHRHPGDPRLLRVYRQISAIAH